MLYCFVDTNIFLQYQTFDEVDWPTILEVPEVCLIVPYRVIQELDKFKADPRSDRRRKRSRTILNKIYDISDSSDKLVRKGTSLLVLTANPKGDQLKALGYEPGIADDEIVGATHAFINDNPDAAVILLAEDTGIRLKAKASGIASPKPPEEIRLQDEADPKQKEINKLRLEVARLQSRQADLSIGFLQDGEINPAVAYAIDFEYHGKSSEDIDKELKRLKSSLKYKPPVGVVELSVLIGKILPSEDEVADYGREVDLYLNNYRAYLESSSEHHWSLQRTVLLHIDLSSTGSIPAQDIDVSLVFPKGS